MSVWFYYRRWAILYAGSNAICLSVKSLIISTFDVIFFVSSSLYTFKGATLAFASLALAFATLAFAALAPLAVAALAPLAAPLAFAALAPITVLSSRLRSHSLVDWH